MPLPGLPTRRLHLRLGRRREEPGAELVVSAQNAWMSAGIDGGEPEVVEGQVVKREPVDLDRAQDLAWALAGIVLTLLGTVATAVALWLAFAPWVGCALVLAVGLLAGGYSLAKSERRKSDRQNQAAYAKGREPSFPTRSGQQGFTPQVFE